VTGTRNHHALRPRRWRQHGPPKRWCPTTALYGATPQKTTNCLHRCKNLGLFNHLPPWRCMVISLVNIQQIYLCIKPQVFPYLWKAGDTDKFIHCAF